MPQYDCTVHETRRVRYHCTVDADNIDEATDMILDGLVTVEEEDLTAVWAADREIERITPADEYKP